MKVFHQSGHNYSWNIQSLEQDNAGDGIIFSPVNITSDNLDKIDAKIKARSFFDPQFYLPKTAKGKLQSYVHFPANLKNGFDSKDFEAIADGSAKSCIDYQIQSDFAYVVIPARYFDHLPSDYLGQAFEYFVNPFVSYAETLKTGKELLLTVIVKQDCLIDEVKRNELLNWITGIQGISGVYLIFDNDFTSKQIKNAQYLFSALVFIHELKMNDLKVHVGYNNTEGILYSIADPDSVCMGSYENLRAFNIRRFETSETPIPRGPNPRLYSRSLFQMIDYGYVDAIKALYSKWDSVFEDSKYRPLLFATEYNWHFTKPEPYKHLFLMFSKAISELPEIDKRPAFLRQTIVLALQMFDEIKQAGVALDGDSDGSHLNFWLTSMKMYEKYLKGK